MRDPGPAPWPVGAGLLAGWAADVVLGDPRRAHPVALFGQAMTALEGRIWRDARGPGVAYALVGVALGAGPVLVLDRRWRDAPIRRAALTAIVTWAALGGRSLATAGEELGRRVAEGDLDGARALAPTLVGRDPATLDGAGLARAGLESVAENTSDAIVAPFAWGALLGAPGVALHRALNTMDAMVGHRSPRYARFGWASARADDLAGWPAARAGAALTVLAATWPGTRGAGGAGPDGRRAAPGKVDEQAARGAGPDARRAAAEQADEQAAGVCPDGGRADAEPADDPAAGWPRPDGGRAEASPNGASATGGPRSALRAWWRDGAAHPSPNAGRVEAAFAGALGVRLGGRNVYGGRVEERPVLHGEGRAPGPADLRRAADLSRRVGALAAVAAAGAAVLLRRR